MRVQVELLEHHADLGTKLIHFRRLAVKGYIIDHQLAPLEGLERVDAADQRALPRATRPADHDHFAAAHTKIDVVEHVQITEVLVH